MVLTDMVFTITVIINTVLTNYHDKETLIKAYDQDGKIHFAQATG